MSKTATTPAPLTFTTAKGLKSGDRIRYAGQAATPGKPQVLTITRDKTGITLADSKGREVVRFGNAGKAWIGDTTVTALPGRTSPAPKPQTARKPKAAPKPRVDTAGVVTSPTGLDAAALSARAVKAAASRAARKADPSFVPPSQRGSALPENHPHRIRAAKAAESRKRALADPSFIPASRRPSTPADKSAAARQAWATRRATAEAASKAEAAAARKAKRDSKTATTAAPKRTRKTA